MGRLILLVIGATNGEDSSLELVADGTAINFITDLAVHENSQLSLIFDFEQLLRAVRWVGNVELHIPVRSVSHL
jgi:hypothetical protein